MTDPESRLPSLLLTLLAGFLLVGHALWGWVPILDSANAPTWPFMKRDIRYSACCRPA